MKTEKRIGIFMDHSTAHFIEIDNAENELEAISSTFNNFEKHESLSKSESLMHNKEQHETHDFYKKISEIVLKYNHVLLFGPTNAKVELYNILEKDHRFENIKIEHQTTEKLTENQQTAFVNDFFMIK